MKRGKKKKKRGGVRMGRERVSNYALVRILVLRFVIPCASTEVNSHTMKLHPTCGALFGVSYA